LKKLVSINLISFIVNNEVQLMFVKLKGLFSFSNDLSSEVVTRDSQKRCSRGKGLTVEETLLLASGMDLKTIRGRKKNPIFVKMPSTAQTGKTSLKQKPHKPSKGFEILKQHQPQSEEASEVNISKKELPEAVPAEPLTENALQKLGGASDKQQSDLLQQKKIPSELYSEMNQSSVMMESICSKTQTSSIINSAVGRSSKMSTSQYCNSQCMKLKELSCVSDKHLPEYQKCLSPLAEHWESIQNEKVIASTRKRFFMAVPKPMKESLVNWVTTVVSGSKLVLPDYYQPRKLIGRGAYACVFEALDTRTDKIVAIKRNRGFMKDVGDAKRILRELKLWMWFQHQDVCNFLDVVPILHKNIFSFQDIYFVLERMDADLSQAIKLTELSKDHCQVIIYQILRSLKYIHSANVIHRDLKPDNVLIQALQCNTKITDFGCSRPLGLEDPCPDILSEYVVTRWYRSPEIYLCSHEYGKACDLWALGCIFAEIYRKGAPLFPGPKCHKKQLQLIFKTVGKPKRLDWIKNPRALKFMKKLQVSDPIPLEVLCPGICKDGADLLSRLLKPDPRDRISVEDAIAHPFVSSFRERSTEVKCQPFDIAYERDPRVKSKRGIRMMLYETVKEWAQRKTAKAH